MTILAVSCDAEAAHCGSCSARTLDARDAPTCPVFSETLTEDRERKHLRCKACLRAEAFAQALVDGTHEAPQIGGARG